VRKKDQTRKASRVKEGTIMTKARDLMTKEVKYIQEEATIKETLSRMKGEKVSSFIVERRDHDDAFGIITRKDIVTKVVEAGRDPEYTKVKDIMTKPLLMISPGLKMKYVARFMKMANIRRAPVFDGEKIVGIVSNTDILNTLVK
jgi:CBS domain-containing protein